jgi:hypothetical protein
MIVVFAFAAASTRDFGPINGHAMGDDFTYRFFPDLGALP